MPSSTTTCILCRATSPSTTSTPTGKRASSCSPQANQKSSAPICLEPRRSADDGSSASSIDSPVLQSCFSFIAISFASAFSTACPVSFTALFRPCRCFTPSPKFTSCTRGGVDRMCGISGLVTLNGNCGDAETLARMTSVQSHRGPDDSGLWERRFPDGTYIGLGSRRLAILDLSPVGHMPMCNEGRTVWITYNGEIYNFADLRREFELKGHRFSSHTDTEVLLHLYEQEGPDCVKRLNGMFAFAICDLRSTTPTLFMARDHFGVKPFYYFHDGDRFAFASA